MASKSPVPSVPAGLQRRGAELWSSLGQVAGTASGELALEACRAADRLDELDSIITGKGVLNLLQFRLKLDLAEMVEENPDLNIHIQIAQVLGEARQQQSNFKSLLAELGFKVVAPTRSGPKPAATGLDQLAARRSKKS